MSLPRPNVRPLSNFEYFVVAVRYPARFNKSTNKWEPSEVQAIVDTDDNINGALRKVHDALCDGLHVEFVHRIAIGEEPEDLTEEMVNTTHNAILEAAE